MEAPPRSSSQEFFDSAVSSLASVIILNDFLFSPSISCQRNCLKFAIFQGWSIMSSSAAKIASKATENAIKIGGMASQKVPGTGLSFNKKKKRNTHYPFIFLFFYAFT